MQAIDQSVWDAFLAKVKEGLPVAQVLKLPGMPGLTTVQNYRKAHPEYDAEIRRYIRKVNSWTKEEDQALREIWPDKEAAFEHFKDRHGRAAVEKRSTTLGLARNVVFNVRAIGGSRAASRKAPSELWDDIAEKVAKGMSFSQVSRLPGMPSRMAMRAYFKDHPEYGAHILNFRRRYRGRIYKKPTYTPTLDRWPYFVRGYMRSHEVIDVVQNIVPRGLPDQARSEICQEMCTAILSGELRPEDAKTAYPQFLRAYNRTFDVHNPPMALDQPIFAGEKILLLDLIDSETFHL